MKTRLIIDFNNMLCKSIYAMPYLTSKDGMYTGGLFGFLKQMCFYINETDASSVIVCQDSPPYRIKKIYKDYKNNRKKLNEELYLRVVTSRELCTELLGELKIPVWKWRGAEADDLIYLACQEAKDNFSKVVVVSSDTDLFQLFELQTEGFKVLLNSSGRFYSFGDFATQYPGISIEDWQWVLALAGTHNGIPGIKGVGIKSAIKILKQNKLDNLVKQHPEINLYKRVVKLPFVRVNTKILPNNSPSYNSKKFFDYLKRYNIELTQQMVIALRRWQQKQN